MTKKVIVLSTLYFILLLITGPKLLFSQEDQVKTLTVVPIENQPSAVVQSVFEDSFGFIWLGTYGGVYRYDGYEFLKYDYNPSDSTSIPPNFFFLCFVEDEDGDLWIGSGNALIHFNRATEAFETYVVDSTLPETYPHVLISMMMLDSKGILWTGSMLGGLRKFNREKGTFTSFMREPGNMNSWADNILALFEDSSNNLWVSTGMGLYTFDRETEEFILFEPLEKPEEWDDIVVLDIYEDKSKCLWFGTAVGLFKYCPELGFMAHFVFDPEDPESLWRNDIVRIIENPVDSGNSLWVFSRDYLNKFDLKSERKTSCRYQYTGVKRKNIILTTATRMIDQTGRMWLGTDNLGAVTINLNENKIEQYIPEFEAPAIEDHSPLSFFKNREGFLWVGTLEGALLKFDIRMNLVKQFNELPPMFHPDEDKMFIYSFYKDSGDKLWLSHWNRGLYCFDPESDEFTNYILKHPLAQVTRCLVTEVVEDSCGYIWAGTGLGTYYADKNNIKDSRFHCTTQDTLLRDVQTRSLCCDKNGNVWIGTQGQGLFCLTPDNRDPFQFINYRHDPMDPHSISSNQLMAVHVDNNDNLWIGTNNGLNKFIRESATFSHYNRTNGFDADFIYSIQSDQNGILWVSTERGLVRFNPAASEGKQFKILKVEDGLPFDNIYPYKISILNDGYLYVAGRRGSGNGFMRFHPDSIFDSKHIPQLALTGFNVKNEPFKLDSSILLLSRINLRYNENFFSFEFTALDYKNPEENQYSYQLVGFDDDFIYSGTRRFANYTGVPPGDYVFRVKGSNSDGYWNEEGVSIKISISPPPWKTWWAYTFYGLILALVVYGLRRVDLKRQRLKQSLEIEHVEAEKLKELDGMKSRFFANISHEFRTPLTLILGPLQKLLSKSSDPESQQDLGIMQRNATRLQNLINQLLELSKLESGKMKLKAAELDVIPLIKGYVQSFESLAMQKNINLVLDIKDETLPVWIDREKFEKILFNLLSNAFKFTPEGGRIEVKVLGSSGLQVGRTSLTRRPEKTGELLEIQISDTGPGIPQNKLPHIFDRFYQADDSYTKDQEGSGIGLALTKELVELHYGRIEVESEVGTGTVFRVYLPLGREHLASEEIDANWQSAIGNQQLTIGSEEMNEDRTPLSVPRAPDSNEPIILIVEDNSDLRLYIRGYLDQTYGIIEAKDGKQGLERAIEHIPDLIISDVMMPEMDGFEMSSKLKADERTSHIPVILLTARASMESKIEGLETGADDFLTKPFDAQELLVRIRNLIDQRKKLKERYVKESGAGRFMVTTKPFGELLSMDEQFLKKIKAVVEKNLPDSSFSVEDFASKMNLSRVQLHRKLKALIDLSASDYIRTLRLNKAAELIAHKTANIAEIAYDVGFTNPSHFSESFKKHFGVLPSEFKG